eukprot:jgi/Galph1/6/GphlegSOOS_G1.1
MYICLLGFDQVEATFEFFDPSLQDVPAINRFLQAQMIAEQQTVGTIIRLGEDCVGFITCLPAQVVGKNHRKVI